MRYDVVFIAAALLCLLGGESLGIYMGVAQDFTFSPVHAHLNLAGWATLAVYGLIYRAYPALGASRIAPWQVGLGLVGSVGLPLGIFLSMTHTTMVVVQIASLAMVLGTLLLGVMFARKAASARAS